MNRLTHRRTISYWTTAACLAFPIAANAQSKPSPERGPERPGVNQVPADSPAPDKPAAGKPPASPGSEGRQEAPGPARGEEARKRALELRDSVKRPGTEQVEATKPNDGTKAHSGQRAGSDEGRQGRRQQRQEALVKRWGREKLAHPSVQAALKIHSWRMARLERAQALAEESDKPNKAKLLERISKLIQKEEERHQKKLASLAEPGRLATGEKQQGAAGEKGVAQ